MDKVQHFEVPADDVKRASKFYKEVFGWEIMPVPDMEYTVVHTAKTDKDGMILDSEKTMGGVINGGLMERDSEIKHPVVTITVEDIDKKMEMIKKHGGKMIKDKMDIPDMGWAAYFKDSEGNVMGLFEMSEKM